MRLTLIRDERRRIAISGMARFKGKHYQIQTLSGRKQRSARRRGLTVQNTLMAPVEVGKLVESCGITTSTIEKLTHEHTHRTVSVAKAEVQPQVSKISIVRLATDADYGYYLANGSSEAATKAKIASIVNAVNGLYEHSVNVRFLIGFQNVWRQPDPYNATSHVTLFQSFRNHWNSRFDPSQNYDIAHLFTTRDLGNIKGYASIGVFCETFANGEQNALRYGLSVDVADDNLDVAITAHELGHNLGALHDPDGGGWIMTGSAGTYRKWSKPSVSIISQRIFERQCLQTEDALDIEGLITMDGVGLPGIEVFSNGLSEQVTYENGDFAVRGFHVDTEKVTIAPERQGYVFTPPLVDVFFEGSNKYNVEFQVTCASNFRKRNGKCNSKEARSFWKSIIE